MSKRIQILRLVGIVAILLAWSATSVSSAQGTRGVTLWEGKAAIAKYSEVTGKSVAETEAMIARARSVRQAQKGGIQPMQAGGFYAQFIPDCTFPNVAWGLFDTGPLGYTVQFHGTSLWSGSGSCMGIECTIIASASLNQPGDRVWVYSVTSIWAYNISNWCGSSG